MSQYHSDGRRGATLGSACCPGCDSSSTRKSKKAEMQTSSQNRPPLMKEWQQKINAWAHRKQWRGPEATTQRTFGDDIALVHSEASEALEAFRESGDPLASWETYEVQLIGGKIKNLSREQVELMGFTTEHLVGKPEGVGSELADVLIRVFDIAEHYGLDMDYEVQRKMDYNETRELKHGGKKL